VGGSVSFNLTFCIPTFVLLYHTQDKSPLSSAHTTSTSASSLSRGNRVLLGKDVEPLPLRTTNVKNGNSSTNGSSAFSSSMLLTSFRHHHHQHHDKDDNISCSSTGDHELNQIHIGAAQYQALQDSLGSVAALGLRPIGIRSNSKTFIRSSSAPSLKRASSTNHLLSRTLPFKSRSPSPTTTILPVATSGYTSIRDHKVWPVQSQQQQQQQPGEPSITTPSMSVQQQQQSRSPVQSPLQDEPSMRQSPSTNPSTPPPPPSPGSSSWAKSSPQAAPEKVGAWSRLIPTLHKPRAQHPPRKTTRPPTLQPAAQEQLTPPFCKQPLPVVGKSPPQHWPPSKELRQPSPCACRSMSSPPRKSPEQQRSPLSSSQQQQQQQQEHAAAAKSGVQTQEQEPTRSSPPTPLPSSCTKELRINPAHSCWLWNNNSIAPPSVQHCHHPEEKDEEEDQVDVEVSFIEQAKEQLAAAGLNVATTTTTRATGSTLETVYSMNEVQQQQELSRNDLRQEESLLETEESSSPRRATTTTTTTTTAPTTAGASDASTAAGISMAEEKLSCLNNGMMQSHTNKSIDSSKPACLNTTNGTTAATASSFSYSAYKVIKESKANRKALAVNNKGRQPQPVLSPAPTAVDEPELLLRRNSILDDSVSRGTALSSKVSFFTEDNVRYYKLSDEEREHKRSGSLPSLCATEDEVREIRKVLATLYLDSMESICVSACVCVFSAFVVKHVSLTLSCLALILVKQSIKKGCDAGMSFADILNEHGPLEFLVCAGSKESDSSAVTSDTVGSYSTATYSTTPTQKRGVIKSPSKLVGTSSSTEIKEENVDAGVSTLTKRAVQQHRKRIMLNRQRHQESLALDEEDDIIEEPFAVDMSRIDTFEDSLIGWPSESACWGGRGEKCVSTPPPVSPTLDSSKKDHASIA
jgi:hypothetical protein